MNKTQARLIVAIAVLAVVAALGTAVASANSPDDESRLSLVHHATSTVSS